MKKKYLTILNSLFILLSIYKLSDLFSSFLFTQNNHLSKLFVFLTSPEFKTVTHDVAIFHIPPILSVILVSVIGGIIRYYLNINHPWWIILILFLWIDFIGVFPGSSAIFSFSKFMPLWARVIESCTFIFFAIFLTWLSQKISDFTLNIFKESVNRRHSIR